MPGLAANPSQEQIATIYRKHSFMVRSRAAQFFAAEETVDDIMQEVFLTFVKKTRSSGVQSVASTLYHLTTCACLESLRRMRRDRNSVDASTVAVVDENVALVSDRLMLTKALTKLDEKVALTALYYHVDGMEQTDVAKILGVSKRTVIRHLQVFAKAAAKRLERPVSDPNAREVNHDDA